MPGIALDETTVTTTRSTYSAAAPDGSPMTAVVENDVAVFTVGGLSLNVTTDSLPVLSALVATVAAQYPVTIETDPPATDPAPETTP